MSEKRPVSIKEIEPMVVTALANGIVRPFLLVIITAKSNMWIARFGENVSEPTELLYGDETVPPEYPLHVVIMDRKKQFSALAGVDRDPQWIN